MRRHRGAETKVSLHAVGHAHVRRRKQVCWIHPDTSGPPPYPSFVWTRADGRLMYNGRTKVYTDKLTIQRVRKEDRGEHFLSFRTHSGAS